MQVICVLQLQSHSWARVGKAASEPTEALCLQWTERKTLITLKAINLNFNSVGVLLPHLQVQLGVGVPQLKLVHGSVHGGVKLVALADKVVQRGAGVDGGTAGVHELLGSGAVPFLVVGRGSRHERNWCTWRLT